MPGCATRLTKRWIDINPAYVSTESLYNFHPAEVNAANLYKRGQVIDSYHKLVREGGSDVASMLTDHNKKGGKPTRFASYLYVGSGRKLGLMDSADTS